MFNGVITWIRNKLPFSKKLYLEIKLGSDVKRPALWFKVVGMRGDRYIIDNPHYYRRSINGTKVMTWSGQEILEKQWRFDDSLLKPSEEYLRFYESCQKTGYFPDSFTVEHRPGLVRFA